MVGTVTLRYSKGPKMKEDTIEDTIASFYEKVELLHAIAYCDINAITCYSILLLNNCNIRCYSMLILI